MVKLRIGSIKEVMDKSNKHLCLNPLRFLSRCFECDKYNYEYRKYKRVVNKDTRQDELIVDKVIQKHCDSRIVNQKYDNLTECKQIENLRHKKRIEELNNEIASIGEAECQNTKK
jgi:DNA-directed RNA polymerase subunit N (RpoN/RPB10)